MRGNLIENYIKVRTLSGDITRTLLPEDMVIQSMPDVSPTKWHLAHTSWFFETFILKEAVNDYKLFNNNYPYLFNSYYVQAGERWTRAKRGMLSRPSVDDVFNYRKYVDDAMIEFMNNSSDAQLEDYKVRIKIGLNHEQQHQELMLTDIKHVLSLNPLNPVFISVEIDFKTKLEPMNFDRFQGGLFEVGYNESGFFYDNEKPRHKVYLNDFKMGDRLVTNGEYMEFINDGGYNNPLLWLSDGWAAAENNWSAPLYWELSDNEWHYFTLSGFKKINPNEPVAHISFYEADAYARWKGMRLPTEFEWEIASEGKKIRGNFADNGIFHPVPLNEESAASKQFFGDVWEWTSSPYSPYPGYKTPEGAIGEYNGKFMVNQFVLRGGSCAASVSHIRPTYRNFFYPHQRWQFMGLRLAKDV